MFRRIGATKLDVALTVLLALFAIAVIGYGSVLLLRTPPESWTLVLSVIAGVIICGPFQMQIGRAHGFPVVGIAIVMLAILPTSETPYLSVSVWAIGLLISRLLLRRSLKHALLMTGLGSVGACAYVAIQIWFAELGIWPVATFLVATAAYYIVVVGGECLRQTGRSEFDRGYSLASISLPRLGLLVLGIGLTGTVMYLVDSVVIPQLERDPDISRTPFVVLLAALLFYVLAQRKRYVDSEKKLNTLVEAAVELPRNSGDGLAEALLQVAKSIVQASDIELRRTEPGPDEIGSEVQLSAGSSQYLVALRKAGGFPFSRDDTAALTTLAHIAGEAARIQHEVDTLERRANTDPLTGLPNYGAFQQALTEANEHRPYHEGIALLFIDVDDFKQLNDTHGHRAGDDMLRAIADRLQRSAGGGDFVSRVGGDEFVVILTGLVSLEQAKESADRIIESVGERLAIEGNELRPVVSAGLAFSSHREIDARTLVEDADRAMLRVKRSRRDGESMGRSSLSISSHRSTRTNDIVERAIRNNRLLVAFQPIVDLKTNRIWAFEALIRYVDPELGPISPPSLVARAKSLGLMNELTQQVIGKALDAAEQFRKLEPGIACMTVNIELGQISDAELGPFIRDAARAHPDIRLCIELNERSLRSATDELRRDAEQMQRAGVTVALDDYGSNDSAVGALVHFPMNILKIDKSLINNLDDPRQREVINALRGYSENLGYTMVVEGLETRAMVDVMVELGVRSAQGYYFGKPVSYAQTVDRLRRFGAQASIG